MDTDMDMDNYSLFPYTNTAIDFPKSHDRFFIKPNKNQPQRITPVIIISVVLTINFAIIYVLFFCYREARLAAKTQQVSTKEVATDSATTGIQQDSPTPHSTTKEVATDSTTIEI